MSHGPGFLALVEARRAQVKEVTVAEARARIEAGARFIDIREQSEWAAGHAAGAVYLGKGVIERDIEAMVSDKDAELILYCGGGFRSVLAADALQQMGYTNVASMAGGWRDWVSAGSPTE
ncbi:MAG: rhodanese-like domain-containing protein [Gemmatimonadaceae bacterium]